MREIEVKAKVDNFDGLLAKLLSFGCKFSQPIIQKDVIFIPKGMDIPVDLGVNVMRIREQNGKYIFTLKQSVLNQLDCVEKEVEIDDPKTMIEIFGLLGFVQCSAVNKTRQTTKYQDYEICLDSVESLGNFIEVEKITNEEDSESSQKELFDFLLQLGVSPSDRVFDGYDVLIAKTNTTH